MAHAFCFFSFVFAHVWATCRHSSHSPTRSGTPYPGRFRLRGAIVYGNGFRRIARDLPCDPKLAPGPGAFSHDVHMLHELGEALLRERTLHASESGSSKVPSSHRLFTHSSPGPPKSECSGRTAMAQAFDFFSFVFIHVWATCRHSNHSPTRAGTPYPRPLRLRGARVYGNGFRRFARDLPCDPKLAPGPGAFSHAVHMIRDLGKHRYASPHFMHRRAGHPKSPQVTDFHTQFAWAAEERVQRADGDGPGV